MKLLLTFFAILFSFGWFSKDFQIVEGTSQKYAGGREKAGYGTRYSIKLLAQKNSNKLKIDQLWIAEDFFEVSPIKNPKQKNKHDFSKNDTIFIYVKNHIHTDEGMIKAQKEKIVKPPPYKYEGVALIGYKLRNKRKYKVVQKFTELEKIFYP